MDELTLHRYLDGRLDEQQRAAVEAALRSDPAARRSLDALREEARLIGAAMEAQVEPPSGLGRIGARVVATLHLEERSRKSALNTRKLFKQVIWAASFAAALFVCFLLVRPRTPAGSLLSGTHATVTVHGEKRDALKGLHLYDGDTLSTEKGQFIRIGLANAQTFDIDEFSELTIEKSGSAPVLRMSRGRIGVAMSEFQSSLQIELPQGLVTVQPGARVDIWLPEIIEQTHAIWPAMFFGPQVPPNATVANTRNDSPAIVTVFTGYAHLLCSKNTTSLIAEKNVRAEMSPSNISARWVNTSGSRVLDLRGDDGLHTRDGVAPIEWTLLGVMEKPQFVALGHRWGLAGTGDANTSKIADALKQLDTAMQINTDAARAEKIAEGLQVFRQACETLAQNDDRRRVALTLEGLAHFEQGCARFAAGSRKDSDPQVSFEAARVAFDAALANPTGVPAPNAVPASHPSDDWRAAFSPGGATPSMASLPPEAQAALTASFCRAVTLSWTARAFPPTIAPQPIAPQTTAPQLITLDSEEATILIGEKMRAAAKASDVFALLHDELGHSVESLAALLGQALCDAHTGDEASKRKAIEALNVLISKPVGGTDAAARKTLDGIRQAALVELVRLHALGTDARKTLDAAHDFELLFPLARQSAAAKTVRDLLLKGLEAQKIAALKQDRFKDAVEACEALLVARDEADGHGLDAGQVDAVGTIRHIGDRLDRLEALVGAKDWTRAAAESNVLTGSLPIDLQPRFKKLDAIVKAPH